MSIASNGDTLAWCDRHAVERSLCRCPFDSGDDTPTLASHMVDGAAFILDTPADVPAVWGNGAEVLWSEGESLILAGPPGVGKTTITGQLVRALIGLQPDVLGYAVKTADARVLYLAMDRPRQIARALARHFHPDEAEYLAERLVVWKGPPPLDIARHPSLLLELADAAGASVVILDSLKDAAIGLTDDEVGAGYNRARQIALAAGVEVLELHHVRKAGSNGAKPNTLSDLYGSTWITAGAGSVILLWGEAGDPIVDLAHLKQPAEPVGPLRIIHDHEAGHSEIWHATDPLQMMKLAGAGGLTAQALARSLFETDKPGRNEVEKARRRLDKLVRDGLADVTEGAVPPGGGKPIAVYRAITHQSRFTHNRRSDNHAPLPEAEQSRTDHGNHEFDVSAGQTITQPIMTITRPAITFSPPPLRRGETDAAEGIEEIHLESEPDPGYCRDCGQTSPKHLPRCASKPDEVPATTPRSTP